MVREGVNRGMSHDTKLHIHDDIGTTITAILSQQQHNVTQPQHSGWVGHENGCASHPTPLTNPPPTTETQL